MNRLLVTRLAVLFLTAQGLGVVVWWVILLIFPETRNPFFPAAMSEWGMLALLLPDLLPYAGGGLLTAYGLGRRKAWAWPVLCIHAGAAAYAGLYALSLALWTNDGWLGAIMMLPSLTVPLVFAWLLRPGAQAR